MAEKRENYFLLKDCKLFSSWARTKIDRLSNLCQRKTYEAGTPIFRQGDVPDNLYILMEGTVEIIKELQVICKNRWPTGMNSWSGIARKKNQPFTIQVLSNKCDYFGELSIIRNTKRSATAMASTKCSIILIDRLEFLHLLRTVHSQNTINKAERSAEEFISDEHLLESLGSIKGGPGSMAIAGSLTIYPNNPRSRTASPKKKRKNEKKDDDDNNNADYFKQASQQAGAEKNMSKLQSGLTEALKDAKDKAIDDTIYYTPPYNTIANTGKHKRLGFGNTTTRTSLPSLLSSFSESKIIFEPVERNLNEYAKYKIHPRPGEKFLPLSATVVQLDTLESSGRR